MSSTSTPISVTKSKRQLTSHEDFADSKRNKPDDISKKSEANSLTETVDQTITESSTINIPTELATMSPDVHVNLTAVNLEYISDRIGEQFETKLAAMMSNVVNAIFPELIPELA